MALTGSYLDVAEFKARTIALEGLVAGTHLPAGAARAAWTAFIELQLQDESADINARLRKRYDVPFQSPVPRRVLRWLVDLVTPSLYERRGWDPSDAQAASILARRQAALEEIKEAADSETGLFDLPVIEGSTETGIDRGGPRAYSEASPYTWSDIQADAAATEDGR